jgi:hypothetical protein
VRVSPSKVSSDSAASRNRYIGGGGRDRISARNGKDDRIGYGKGRDRVRADAKDRVADDCETVRR